MTVAVEIDMRKKMQRKKDCKHTAVKKERVKNGKAEKQKAYVSKSEHRTSTAAKKDRYKEKITEGSSNRRKRQAGKQIQKQTSRRTINSS